MYDERGWEKTVKPRRRREDDSRGAGAREAGNHVKTPSAPPAKADKSNPPTTVGGKERKKDNPQSIQ